MYAGGGYKLGNYDPRTGKESSKIVGSQSAGNLSLKYLFEKEDEDEDQSEEIANEEILPSAASSKIVHSLAMSASDPYTLKNVDRGTTTKNVGGLGASSLNEFSGYHKNVARKGMSPFKQPKHDGLPIGVGGSKNAWTTGNHKSTGSKEGWSKPYRFKKDNKKRYFSLQSLINDTGNEIKQFTRQKNRIKKIINEVNI